MPQIFAESDGFAFSTWLRGPYALVEGEYDLAVLLQVMEGRETCHQLETKPSISYRTGVRHSASYLNQNHAQRPDVGLLRRNPAAGVIE